MKKIKYNDRDYEIESSEVDLDLLKASVHLIIGQSGLTYEDIKKIVKESDKSKEDTE